MGFLKYVSRYAAWGAIPTIAFAQAATHVADPAAANILGVLALVSLAAQITSLIAHIRDVMRSCR